MTPTLLWDRTLATTRQAAAEGYLVWVLVVVVGFQSALGSEFFLTGRNLSNLAGQSVPLGLAALGQTAMILVGGIDLSVGATARLTALLTAGLIDDEPSRVVPVLVLVLLVAAVIGAVNATMIVRLGIHPLIATLISFTVLRGVALLYTTGPIGGIPAQASGLVYQQQLGVPYPVWLLLLMLMLTGVLLHRTRFGRSVYAAGGAPEVARRAGVNVDWVRFRMMMLCSVMAGLAGIVLAFRQGVGDPRMAEGLELTSIVTVIIGGVSIFGGRGKLLGVMGGVLLLGVIRNAMNLQGVAPLLQGVVTGAIVVFAVALFTRRES